MGHFLRSDHFDITFAIRNAVMESLFFRFFPESQIAHHEPQQLTGRHFRSFLTPAGVIAGSSCLLFPVFFPAARINAFLERDCHFVLLRHYFTSFGGNMPPALLTCAWIDIIMLLA
jgi:hypothetical protein